MHPALALSRAQIANLGKANFLSGRQPDAGRLLAMSRPNSFSPPLALKDAGLLRRKGVEGKSFVAAELEAE
ncbi:hypothetical protein [Shinella sedimenti]|uniref:Uncharacterized protein n=1 Tax=Shinella sedimenti TaxID=2919913 RepID=A0ABT0CT02_9HYPH|nr:hypothetical protein [Shinella sedimenti]MCJ8151741.1 hypothetical protein [Shinella sedimenti]